MLRVDRPEPGERARERIAADRRPRVPPRGRRAIGMTRWPPATSVSLLAVATILAGAEGRQHRPQADDPAGPDDQQVDVRTRRERLQCRLAAFHGRTDRDGTQRGPDVVVGHDGDRRMKLTQLLLEQRRVATCGEPDDVEPRVTPEDIERLPPDGTSRAKHRHAKPRPIVRNRRHATRISGTRRGHRGAPQVRRTGTSRGGRACRHAPG